MRYVCTFSELEIPVCLLSPRAPRTGLKEEGVVNSLLPSNTNLISVCTLASNELLATFGSTCMSSFTLRNGVWAVVLAFFCGGGGGGGGGRGGGGGVEKTCAQRE